MITAEKFEESTGRAPEHDDLERCNCERAGQPGHYQCGWCATHDKPMFECGGACWEGRMAASRRARMEREFPPGTRVVVGGVSRGSPYAGRRGAVLSLIPGREMLRVVLDDDAHVLGVEELEHEAPPPPPPSPMGSQTQHEENVQRFPVEARVVVVESDETTYIGERGVVIGHAPVPDETEEAPLVRVKMPDLLATDGFYAEELELLGVPGVEDLRRRFPVHEQIHRRGDPQAGYEVRDHVLVNDRAGIVARTLDGTLSTILYPEEVAR